MPQRRSGLQDSCGRLEAQCAALGEARPRCGRGAEPAPRLAGRRLPGDAAEAMAALVQVPWRDWGEWRRAYTLLFPAGGLPHPCAPCSPVLDGRDAGAVEAGVLWWREARALLSVWRSRGVRAPALVDATLELLEVVLLDWAARLGGGEAEPLALRLAYGMAVVRGVNLATDELQKGQFAQSVLELAASVGMPRWVVDVRHDATHGQRLPGLQMLRMASEALLLWLRDFYWARQARCAADTDKQLAAAAQACATQLSALEALLSGGEGQDDTLMKADEIDDCVDQLCSAVPQHLFVSQLAPGLVGLMLGARFQPGPRAVGGLASWERAMAGLDDVYQGLTGVVLGLLCDALCAGVSATATATATGAGAGAATPAQAGSGGEPAAPGAGSAPAAPADKAARRKRRRAEAAAEADAKAAAAQASNTRCEPARETASAAEQRLERALAWTRYLCSRRWFSLGDDSLSLFQGVVLAVVYPSKWTPAQAAFMWGAAPAALQDRATLSRAARKALMDPHPWAQRLLAAVLPALALAADCTDALELATALVRTKLGTDTARVRGAAPSRRDLDDLVARADDEAKAPWRVVSSWASLPIGAGGVGVGVGGLAHAHAEQQQGQQQDHQEKNFQQQDLPQQKKQHRPQQANQVELETEEAGSEHAGAETQAEADAKALAEARASGLAAIEAVAKRTRLFFFGRGRGVAQQSQALPLAPPFIKE